MVKNNFPVYDINTLSGYASHDIQISRFAPYLQIHKNLHLAHKHNFYHLLYFTEGGGKHTIDFEQFDVCPGQIYFMVPGQVHGWAFEGKVDGYVINFSVAFFNSFLLRPNYPDQFSFFAGDGQHSVINIPTENQPVIKNLFEQIIAESENKDQLSADMVRAQMLQLFIAVNRVKTEKPELYEQNADTAIVTNFRKLVEQHFMKMKLPKEYAHQLNITPNHLNAVCNHALGSSAGGLIRSRVILEAKRLLVNLDQNISEIAYQLNFADNSYFTKFFKKQTGITPEEFRKQQLNHK